MGKRILIGNDAASTLSGHLGGYMRFDTDDAGGCRHWWGGTRSWFMAAPSNCSSYPVPRHHPPFGAFCMSNGATCQCGNISAVYRPVHMITKKLIATMTLATITVTAAEKPEGADNFYKSGKLTSESVTFPTQYQLKVAGNLYVPKDLDRNAKHAAIVVSHPMGAVKEQSANLYAQKLADQGFVTLSIDLPFWGESEGSPRNAVLPDMYSEAFSAAVDFLGTRPFIDKTRIGGVGICGSGGFLVSAAKIDPRIRAVATVSMYDMGAVTRNGYGRARTVEQRKELAAQASILRDREFPEGKQIFMNYLPVDLPADADPVTAMYHNFYRTDRGAHIPEGRTLELTQNRTLVGEIKFLNFYPFNDIETISPRPMLFIAGDQAHSKEFSEDAHRRAAEPKELLWVKGANHVDLYDRSDLIPFDRLGSFFSQHLKP